MNYYIEPIKNGIIRIKDTDNTQTNYLERYGIVNVPKPQPADGVTVSNTQITLPDGRVLKFRVRPKIHDEFWPNIVQKINDEFADKVPQMIDIDGKDEVEKIDLSTVLGGVSKYKFGISFEIEDDEKFYGLGEAKRDGVQLRGGTYQNWTLYQYNEVAIPFVMSNHNWGLFINVCGRHFVDIDNHVPNRITVLGDYDNLDVFLLYGDSMKAVLALYTELCGKSMLLPKWAYGLTYIAGIHQNQHEILNDVMKFREKHIPCDTVSLEPGWMSKFYDYSFDKEWDRTKFHIDKWMRHRDCKYTFPSVLRRFGFHMMLWMCMNYDLCDKEEQLVSGESKLEPWYEHVKQFVNDGADGFKIDPADMVMRLDPNKVYTNGKSEFEMHNVSQVLVMKQMHEGFAEQMNKRPFIHYCGGYAGQQHWGAATTGDNGGLVGSMIWLQTLAMSGFMNATVDMDIYNPEAIHYAFFAPWAHHNAWQGCGQPWYAGAELEQMYTEYARLRYSLVPYLYSTAIECAETGVPMVRPMVLEFQNDAECTDMFCQYMVGEYLLISAFTDRVYLPQGKWIDLWTGDEYDGNRYIESYTPPKDKGGGLFVKKGAIIPKWCDRDYTTQYDDEEIQLHIYPCGNTEYIFREDDGTSLDYRTKASCHTSIKCTETENSVELTIGDRIGEYTSKPNRRVWQVYVHGTDKPVVAKCADDDEVVVIK